MKNYWLKKIPLLLDRIETPCYVSSFEPIRMALGNLSFLAESIPIKHWLSLKTNPNKRILLEWKNLNLGVEVVSEFELQAALEVGYSPNMILINGVAKHTWITKYNLEKGNLHIDSLTEFFQLKNYIRKNNLNLGLRLHVSNELDPDEPNFHSQFGLEKEEFKSIVILCKKLNIKIKGIHFHLHTNVPNPILYLESVKEVIEVCYSNNLNPEYIDLGGGLPSLEGENYNKKETFNYFELIKTINLIKENLINVKEIWMENGRYLLANSMILIIKVLDIKFKSGTRYLICDSGRTNNALVSDWEQHDFFIYPENPSKSQVFTSVCGNTSMAYDRLFRTNLSEDIKIGDYIIWLNAGAYHIPWETRFSKGLCNVYHITKDNEITIARKKESFNDWWHDWL